MSSEKVAVEEALPTANADSAAAQEPMKERHWGWAVAAMLGALLAAVVVAVAHHIFLSRLDGKTEEVLSQYWARFISNALAQLVGGLLAISVGTALVQALWRNIRRTTYTVDEYDTLFTLPSIGVGSLKLLRHVSAYTVLVLVLVIQAFSLTGTFAPNALWVDPQEGRAETMHVSTIDFERIPRTISAVFRDSGTTYDQPSLLFERVAERIFFDNELPLIHAPDDCGASCHYNITFHGPAARCTEVPANEIGPGGEVTAVLKNGGYLYSASSNLGVWTTGSDGHTQYFNNADNAPYTITVAYVPYHCQGMNGGCSASDYDLRTGSTCTFYNATYSVEVTFDSEGETVKSTVEELHKPLRWDQPYNAGRIGGNVENELNTTPGFLAAVASRALVESLARLLQGELRWEQALSTAYTSVLSSHLFTMETTDSDGEMIFSLTPPHTSLSQALEDTMSTLAVSFMTRDIWDATKMNVYADVEGAVRPVENIYYFARRTLWEVYAVALAIALLADIYGLICLRSNRGEVRGTSFKGVMEVLNTQHISAEAKTRYGKVLEEGRAGLGGVDGLSGLL